MVIGNLATLRLASDAKSAQLGADAELGDLGDLVAFGSFETAVIAELALYRGWPKVLEAESVDPNDPTIVATRLVLSNLVWSSTDAAVAGLRSGPLDASELAMFSEIDQQLSDIRTGFAAEPEMNHSIAVDAISTSLSFWSTRVDELSAGRDAKWIAINYQAEFAAALASEVIMVGAILLAGESTEAQRQEVSLALVATDEAMARLLGVVTPGQQTRIRVAFEDNLYQREARRQVLDLPARFEPLAAPETAALLGSLASFTEVPLQVQAESISLVQAGSLERSRSAQSNRRWMLGATAMMLVIPTLLVLTIGGRTTRRVRSLATAAQRISRGELGVRVDDVTGTDELAVLATAFNEVSATVLLGHDQVAALADGRLDDPVLDRDLPGPIGHTLRVALRRLGTSTAELAHQASHDRLTGLLDRRGFHLAAERIGTDHKRAVLSIDLDGFKSVNDQHGHAAGDAVLEHVAACIKKSARTDDIVARLGGDEFVVIADHSGVQRLASHINVAITTPLSWNGHELVVGGSIGWTTIDPGEAIGVALARADTAMYRAKRQGKGQVHQLEKGELSAVERSL